MRVYRLNMRVRMLSSASLEVSKGFDHYDAVDEDARLGYRQRFCAGGAPQREVQWRT